MIAKQQRQRPAVTIDISLRPNQTVIRIIHFIKEQLPEFEKLFRKDNAGLSYEDDISKALIRFFNSQTTEQGFMFEFNERKGVDFTIFAEPFCFHQQPLFMIEAKRLSQKHDDYVKGKTGGIERIKLGQEQFDYDLTHGAMFGYIQDKDHEYWLKRINKWIEKLIEEDTNTLWNEEDKLVKDEEQANFKSLHSRLSKGKISLYHYWIDLSFDELNV